MICSLAPAMSCIRMNKTPARESCNSKKTSRLQQLRHREELPTKHATTTAATAAHKQIFEFCEKDNEMIDSRKMYQNYQGQLNVTVLVKYEILTIHIIQARHLPDIKGEVYVKVMLSPDENGRTKCRTRVVRLQRRMNNNDDLGGCPYVIVFDDKFSFELLDDDNERRLFISLYHRPIRKASKMIGCMSFGIKNLLMRKSKLFGWYYLLSSEVGKQKHLLDVSRNTISPNLSKRSQSFVPLDQGMFSMSDNSSFNSCNQDNNIYEYHVKRGKNGYGFTVCGGKPTRILTVDSDSFAGRIGVKPNDHLLSIDDQNVSFLNADLVSKIIRLHSNEMNIQVSRAPDMSTFTSFTTSNTTTTTSSSSSGDTKIVARPRSAMTNDQYYNLHVVPILTEDINNYKKKSADDLTSSEDDACYMMPTALKFMNATYENII